MQADLTFAMLSPPSTLSPEMNFPISTEEEIRHIAIDGFFLAIGHKPNTDLFAEFLERDAEGYIKVEGYSPCTNVPGVFAAGDCADPHYRQAIVAAASGCKAAMEAEKYIAALG